MTASSPMITRVRIDGGRFMEIALYERGVCAGPSCGLAADDPLGRVDPRVLAYLKQVLSPAQMVRFGELVARVADEAAG
jgi:hypothetical protein